jgi:dTMP kinase
VSGRFITLEGGEGVGKSTQAKALAGALRARGIEVIETREPGGSEGAEAIRTLILEGKADRWSQRAEALLFAAARADHVEKTIRPAINAGKWVVCDRFLDSSIAYQGDAVGADAVRTLHSIGSEDYLPDRTLVLALPNEEAAVRAAIRDRDGADRIGGRDQDYHIGVANNFALLAEMNPERIRMVNAAGAPEDVTIRLVAALDDLLP